VFIQMVEGACREQDDMRMLVEEWCGRMADEPGWLGGTYGFTDDDRFIGVGRYESAAAWKQCCAAADAGMWWAAAAEMFDSAPEIHQSEDVMMMLDGGSDAAGFVQVMRGKVGNPDKLRRIMTDQDMTSMLHQARPEIIGATLLIEDDGSFTETISFTDEDSARKGEAMNMPAEVAADLQEAMAEVNYYDLHNPWFGRHH
jgi:hypothetical protein